MRTSEQVGPPGWPMKSVLIQRPVDDGIQHRFEMSRQLLASQRRADRAAETGASVATLRCVLGIYCARYAVALGRATTASSGVERQAAFAEARRIIQLSVPLRRQIAGSADNHGCQGKRGDLRAGAGSLTS